MWFYLVLLLILFGLSFHRRRLLLFIVMLLTLAFFLGFRGKTVGADTARYVEYYNYMKNGIGHMEIGWNVLLLSIKSLGVSAYAFHFLIALFTLGLIGFVLTRFHDRQINMLGLFFTYSLGFYLLMFNGMRQLFAGAIVLFAFYFLSVERNKLFVLLVVVASFFHLSSIVALAAFFLRWIRLTSFVIIISLIVTMLIGLTASDGFFVSLAGKYAHDIESYGYRDSIAYTILVGGLSNLFFLYLVNQVVKEDIDFLDSIWMKLYFLSVVVMNLTINIVIGPRIVYVFSICQVVVFSLLTRRFTNPQARALLYLFGIVTFFRFIIPEISRTEESLIPYYFTFQLFAN